MTAAPQATGPTAADVLRGFAVGGNMNGQELPYPEPGRYRLAVKGCKAVRRWDGENMMVVTFEVVTSASTEPGKVAHPPGALFSWIQNLKHQPAVKNLTMFAAMAMGCAPSAVTLEHLVAFCDERGGQVPGGMLAAAGVQLDALFFSGTSKKGNPITKVNFSLVADKTLAALVK